MGRIRVLSDALINRIAAGEVIERPASVVKELLENSIDAGARSVSVECAGGGRRMIAVIDDGAGMDRDDALLAIERHATSKLVDDRGLESIATLGFRGEALSSIAAVSRFTLQSAVVDGEGTEVEVHGGRVRSVGEIAMPRGTTIRVERLFFNVPARRKFLRSEATELGHIARLVTNHALARPDRRFRLVHAGRELLHLDPAACARERIGQLYGDELARRLEPFDSSDGELRVHGFAGRPSEAQTRRDGQHFFVNGRAVKDRVLLHAVGQAYGNTMPRGRHPSLFVFLECAPSDVDVNVHPQKVEVRFRQPVRVHDLVEGVVRSALAGAAVIPRLADLRPAALDRGRAVAEAISGYADRRSPAADGGPASPAGARPATSGLPFAAAAARPVADPAMRDTGSPDSAVVPLAQYRRSYILAQDHDGLLLVDQHAAHERVIFERYLAQAVDNHVEVQRLIFPITIELTAADRVTFDDETAEFERLGFRVEPFGGNSIRVTGVPALAGAVDPRELILELLGEARAVPSTVSAAASLRHRLVTSAACQAAIKVNHTLERQQMQRLLDDLFRTVNPTTCPHGRPLIFRLSHAEIERAFDRR
ncbi:MAG TPA: DNA mismatch repair endonuclease MutL [Candidatus Polarisedimenticolaceae bacterium]|nr:DNA mismatch repair endonuclease MutL [Candidatus Polarisedimenticolaceae bacterium]